MSCNTAQNKRTLCSKKKKYEVLRDHKVSRYFLLKDQKVTLNLDKVGVGLVPDS